MNLNKDKKKAIDELKMIPSVGKAVAQDLWEMGFRCVADLRGQNADLLYVLHNDLKGTVQDICMLYTFRCAIYFANTPTEAREPEKLRWWYWVDKPKCTSVEKDMEIRSRLNV